MKKIIITAIICCSVFAAYVTGQQNTPKQENCCCKHTQQIAEDLHWIRESMSKPFVPPPHLDFPGNPAVSTGIDVPKFNTKLEDSNLNFPKTPKKK